VTHCPTGHLVNLMRAAPSLRANPPRVKPIRPPSSDLRSTAVAVADFDPVSGGNQQSANHREVDIGSGNELWRHNGAGNGRPVAALAAFPQP